MTSQINFALPEDDVNKPHGEWKLIPVAELKTPEEKKLAHRLNALGSLFYFSKVVLRNHRLSEDFHLGICKNLEKEHLKEILEVPRDHFKSTICSESAPMWWALPFTDRDINFMQKLGYQDEWIRWMKRAHNQDTRTLLVSENITNAAKLGVRIDGHYSSNDLFKLLFPEVIPGSNSSWTQFSKTHKRSARSKPHGEGTYDYLGVGAALQSRHYDRVIQDDLVGKAAVESDSIMQKTIEYHKLLVGAFDSDRAMKLDNDEIVVGNRWSWRDLNSYIREHESYFNITNHSALGGCCPLHPPGKPIFPEEFTIEKLERFQKRLGPYLFSCQFLNQPIPPKDTPFTPENLRYYQLTREMTKDGGKGRIIIRHEVTGGQVINDIPLSALKIVMVVDPNHAAEEGRCNHAITVVGVYKGGTKETERAYLLDCWAESASFDKFIAKIYELAEKWQLREFYLETIAAQSYLKYHLEYRNRVDARKLRVKELKTPRTKNAKDQRILALGPLFENQQFWCRRSHTVFIQEYSLYPNGKTRDLLDTLGYGHQVWSEGVSAGDYHSYLREYSPEMGTGPCGY